MASPNEPCGLDAGDNDEPLSAFLGTPPPPEPPAIDWPVWDDTALADNFIPLLNFMLQFTTETPDETAIRARIAKIGIGPGRPFDLASLSAGPRLLVRDHV